MLLIDGCSHIPYNVQFVLTSPFFLLFMLNRTRILFVTYEPAIDERTDDLNVKRSSVQKQKSKSRKKVCSGLVFAGGFSRPPSRDSLTRRWYRQIDDVSLLNKLKGKTSDLHPQSDFAHHKEDLHTDVSAIGRSSRRM